MLNKDFIQNSCSNSGTYVKNMVILGDKSYNWKKKEIVVTTDIEYM